MMPKKLKRTGIIHDNVTGFDFTIDEPLQHAKHKFVKLTAPLTTWVYRGRHEESVANL